MKKVIRLFQLSKAPMYLILIVVGSMLFLAAFNVILSALLQEGLNVAIYEKDIYVTSTFAILLLVSCFIYLVLSYIYPVYREKLFQCISKNLKSKVLQGVLNKPLKETEEMAEGDFLTSVVEDCDNCSGYLIHSVLPAVQLLINIVIGIVFVFCREWRVGLIVVVLIPMFYFLNKTSAQKFENAYEEYLIQEGRQKTYFTEVHNNIPFILAYSLQGIVNKKNKSIYKDKFQAARKQAKSIGTMVTFTETGVLCTELVILLLGLVCCQMGWIKFGTMIAVWNVAIGSVIYPIAELPYALTGLIGQIVSLERIENNIWDNKECHIKNTKKDTLNTPQLKVSNVRYKVSDTFQIYVNDFQCKQGQLVYIVGSSGSGKTTFAKLLLSLYQPDTGKIIIEDKSKIVEKINDHISYVPQEKMVCGLSVIDNITMGDSSISEEIIEKSLIQANIYHAITEHEMEYEAVLGKDVNLSVGQEQRIAIARAYARAYKKGTEFIIFDEPFASLDENNVNIISSMIKKMSQKCGCIVITHNTSMITTDDIVYQFKGGDLYEGK